ncbi:MAG: pentapeptide repeat-containing protein [Hyphomicrobiaceae bacterium]
MRAFPPTGDTSNMHRRASLRWRRHITIIAAACFMTAALTQLPPAPLAADMGAREVTEALVKATRNSPADLASLDLTYLDLSALDFKAARLSDADLYGADLTSADLSGADLSYTRLDRATIIRAKFVDANLERATLLRPTVFSDMRFDRADAPDFTRARLIGARFQARIDGASFTGADLTDADFSPLEDRPGEGTITTVPKNEMSNSDFTSAILVRTNLSRAILRYAVFAKADLTNAVLERADLTGANLSGADLSGADLTGADLARVDLRGAKGLDKARGLASALNLETALR